MNKQKWIECALSAGFESFEIYQTVIKERSMTWFEGRTDTYVTSRVTGTSMRGIINGKAVNLATEDLSDDDMENTVASLKEQAAVITSDDPAVIRRPQPFEPVPQTREWVRPSAAAVRELLADIEQRVLAYDERFFRVMRMRWAEETSVRTIVNSYGLDAEDACTVQYLTCGAAAGKDSGVRDGYRTETVADINTFDRDSFVRKLCTGVLNKLNAGSIPSGNYPVIIEHDAMTSLFTAFVPMFSGELIARGISPLRDKLGVKIFSDLVTVIDDPRSPEAPAAAAFDDEGCPTFRKAVVENGVFRTILHNSASAAKMDTESTGNGFRRSYSSVVSVQPMNLSVLPGDKSPEELCADMADGLVITAFAGLHAGINILTADFSLQCSGYLVKNGVRERGVTLITAAGNFLELMRNISAVGNDQEWGAGTICIPSISFKSIAIAGE